MRILFVLKEVEDEQLSVMYLSSILKTRGHETGLVMADYDIMSRKLEDRVPTILAYSTLGFYSNYYLELNRRIKKRFNVFSIFGGVYPTSYPQILEEEGVDSVCIGEGEYPLLELADRLKAGKIFNNINNLWVKIEGRIFRNEPRPLISNLDELIFPDRQLFTLKSPFFVDRISMITSRGCSYSCPYCYNNTTRRIYSRENIYRRRTVDNVLQEIKDVRKKQEVKFILFYDDIFILMPEWIEEFSCKYKADINIPFWCNVRANLVTEQAVFLLKKANCYSVSFGLESGNNHLRNSVLHRNISEEEILSKVALLKDNGIRIRTTNIIGIPGGSIDQDIESLKLNIKCRVDYARVTMFSAYPNMDSSLFSKHAQGNFCEYHHAPSPKIADMLGKYSIAASGRFHRMVYSSLVPRYGFKDESEKRRIVNLYRLFGIAANFPLILPLVYLLIRMPVNRLFIYIDFLWLNYCSYFKLYPTCGWYEFFRRISKHKKAIMQYRKDKHMQKNKQADSLNDDGLLCACSSNKDGNYSIPL